MTNQRRQLSRRTLGSIAALLALTLAVTAYVVGPALGWTPIDFCRFYAASKLIIARQDPYGQFPFFAPPWLAFLISPLLALPCPSAALMWTLLNVALVIASSHIVWPLAVSSRRRCRLLLIALTGILPYALFTYITGQLTAIALASCALCAWGLAASRPWPVVVGLILATLKPHVVALPMLLVFLELLRRRWWQPVAMTTAVLVGMSALALVFVPTWPRALLSAWTGGAFYEPRDNLLGLGPLNVPFWLTLPFVAYVLLTWRRFDLCTLALAVAANLLVMPYSRSYDYILLLIPLAAAWSAPRSLKRRFALGLTALAQLLPLARTFAPRVGLLEALAPTLCMLGLLLISQCREAESP